MKKRIYSMIMVVLMMFSLSACSAERSAISEEEFAKKWKISRNAEDNKVIIDVDLMYLNDDAYAVLAAAQADSLGYIDLLGITATTCNAFASASAYDTLYLLQNIDRLDIPVYMGESIPRNGFVDIEKVKKECGISNWYGCYVDMDRYTDDVNKAYELGICKAKEKLKDSAVVKDESAVDFIIEQVHKYPGKVTLFTLGALTTASKAIEKDPTVVDDAAGIIIMGGDFGARIDNLRDYDINFWFDPEATNMVLSAPWKEKTIVSCDVAMTSKRNKEIYDQLKSKNTGKASKCVVDALSPIYENGKEEALPYCWDLVTVVYFLYPDIMTKIEARAVCVDEREGLTYGLTRDWRPGTEPQGVSVYDVIFECDGKLFWDFVSDIYSIDK